MPRIETVDALDGAPVGTARVKVTDRLTRTDRSWIGRCRFVGISSVGPEGADLWRSGGMSEGLPSVGDLPAETKAGVDGAGDDAGWAARAKHSLW